MKIALHPNLSKRLWQLLTPTTGWFLVVQISVAAFVLLGILSLSSSIFMLNSPIPYLQGDVCEYWRKSRYETQREYTWWQRACIMERDWEKMDYNCRDVRLMGNWPVCFDEPYSPVQKNKPCIVYSFGIANDFRFDDALAKHNCTVYAFDPSMGAKNHLRGKSVYFYSLGLAAEDNEEFSPRKDGYAASSDRWKVLKLSSIMKMLGHTGDSVSLIKMDVENNEWDILDNLLSEDVLKHLPQVLVEWHIFQDSPKHNRFKKMHADYNQFKALGFSKFWMRNEGRNHWLPRMTTQAETAFVNVNYKKQQHNRLNQAGR